MPLLYEKIHQLFTSTPLTLKNEASLQLQIADLFRTHQIPYEREVRLDAKNRIDFICEAMGIEVKIHAPAKAIFKQLERYCRFEQIQQIVLVTGRTIGLPATILGKDCYLINLSRAWL